MLNVLKICLTELGSNKPIEGCRMSVDGTDCPIQEPTPFNKGWYSHKFHGPGVGYEVPVSVQSAYIVWASAPRPCGSFSNVRIFRNGLMHMLRIDEFVVADDGFADTRCIQPAGQQ